MIRLASVSLGLATPRGSTSTVTSAVTSTGATESQGMFAGKTLVPPATNRWDAGQTKVRSVALDSFSSVWSQTFDEVPSSLEQHDAQRWVEI